MQKGQSSKKQKRKKKERKKDEDSRQIELSNILSYIINLVREGKVIAKDPQGDPVDGSQKSGQPVDRVNIPLFTGFCTSQVVVWDF